MDDLVERLTTQHHDLQNFLVTLTKDLVESENKRYDLEHDIELLKKEHELDLLKKDNEIALLKQQSVVQEEMLASLMRYQEKHQEKQQKCPFKNSEGVVVCPVTGSGLGGSGGSGDVCGVDGQGCVGCPCEPKV